MCKMTICTILLALLFSNVNAKSLSVNINSSTCHDVKGQPFCHITPAIAMANPDDEIYIANGNYIETLLVEKNLKLIGGDRLLTVIDGDRKSSVIEVSPGVHAQFKNLSIQNGHADNGGGILNHGSVLLTNVHVIDNWARFSGGGIYSARSISGSLYMKNSIIERNRSLGDDKRNIKYGGGGIFNDAPLVMENTRLQYNQAVDNGGGLYSVYSGRKKSSEGEIIAEKLGISSASNRLRSLKRVKNVGAVRIINSNINHNYAEAGGGINLHGVLNISTTIISENQATNGFRSAGGGLFAHFDTTLNMNNVIVSYNTATFRGGGVRFYTVGSGTFSNVSIIDNKILKNFGQGAGIFIIKGEKTLTIQNTLIARNYTDKTKLDDCQGSFQSSGNNYFSEISHCIGYNPERDIHVPMKGVDHLYQWDESMRKYHALVSSELVDKGNNMSCNDEKGNPLSKDVYGNPRHVNTKESIRARCDIGAIEYDRQM